MKPGVGNCAKVNERWIKECSLCVSKEDVINIMLIFLDTRKCRMKLCVCVHVDMNEG
jgi:hypothetical protein